MKMCIVVKDVEKCSVTNAFIPNTSRRVVLDTYKN
jgi:hypothetical protein